MITSIIVPTFDLSNKLDTCLESLFKFTDPTQFKIIVVDNGSTDNTRDITDKYLRPTDSYVNLGHNYGFAKACNVGVNISDSDLILLLNNDITFFEEGWLDDMKTQIFNGVTIVGTKLLYKNNTIQHIGLGFNKEGYPIHIGRGEKGDKYHGAIKVIATTFACVLIAREDYLKLGGLDETYQNGYEDLDMCMRVNLNNGQIFVTMDKIIYHDECSTPGRMDNEKTNFNIFIKRWVKVLFGFIGTYIMELTQLDKLYQESIAISTEQSTEVDNENIQPETPTQIKSL